MEIHQIKELLAAAGALLVALIFAAPVLRPVLLLLVGAIPADVQTLRAVVLRLCPPIDPSNKNRLVASFTEEECWRDLRFRNGAVPNDLVDVFGFIDGNNQEIARPREHNNTSFSRCNFFSRLPIRKWRLLRLRSTSISRIAVTVPGV
jgi:hypothetical protein